MWQQIGGLAFDLRPGYGSGYIRFMAFPSGYVARWLVVYLLAVHLSVVGFCPCPAATASHDCRPVHKVEKPKKHGCCCGKSGACGCRTPCCVGRSPQEVPASSLPAEQQPTGRTRPVLVVVVHCVLPAGDDSGSLFALPATPFLGGSSSPTLQGQHVRIQT